MRRQEIVVPPERVEQAVAKQLGTEMSHLLHDRGNSHPRDVLLLAWRELSGLSNREMGHRLGHADGATVGKRFQHLRSNAEHHDKVKATVAAVRIHPIANCKA